MSKPLPDVDSGDLLWWRPGRVTYFRYLAEGVARRPDSPWRGSGRFDDGVRFTLYLARSPEGAAAEYYRRHPEFLDLQESVKIQVFQLDMELPKDHLDVRTSELAEQADISFDRLRSNDQDAEVRFRECRELAARVESSNGYGLAYPSAAHDGESNLVAFGEREVNWRTLAIARVRTPHVHPSRVQVLPPARLS